MNHHHHHHHHHHHDFICSNCVTIQGDSKKGKGMVLDIAPLTGAQ